MIFEKLNNLEIEKLIENNKFEEAFNIALKMKNDILAEIKKGYNLEFLIIALDKTYELLCSLKHLKENNG